MYLRSTVYHRIILSLSVTLACLIAGGRYSIAAAQPMQQAATPAIDTGPPGLPIPWPSSASCWVLDNCARFDGLDVHATFAAALHNQDSAGRVALAGQVMLSVTALYLFEVGGAFGGYANHDDSGEVHYHSSVARVFGKLRLWPLPWQPPSTGLRIALTFEWTLTASTVGLDELPGVDTTSVMLHFARTLGPVDLDFGFGTLLYTLPEGLQPKLALSATAALPLLGGRSPLGGSDIISVCAQALYRFNLRSDGRAPNDAYAIGCLDYRGSTGYRFSIGAGAYVLGAHTGPYGQFQFQFTYGSTVANPVSEKWAGHEWKIPDFIWDILGAIDPVLGPDGCVYSDPKPNEPQVKLFCIGQPAGNNEILLPNGTRLPVGKHLLILGRDLVDQAGQKVADVPWMHYLRSQAGTAMDSLVQCITTYGPEALYVVDESIGGCITGGVEGVLPFPQEIPLPGSRRHGPVFQMSEGLCQAVTGAAMLVIGYGEANAVLRGGAQTVPQLALAATRGGTTTARSVAATRQLADQCIKSGYLLMAGAASTASGVEKIGQSTVQEKKGSTESTTDQQSGPSKGKLAILPNGEYSASELDAAKYMASHGHDVVLRPPSGTRAGGGTSDLLIDGKRFDVYTPVTGNPDRIISAIAKKNTQAEGIILDLRDSPVRREQLGDVLRRVQKAGADNIQQVIILER